MLPFYAILRSVISVRNCSSEMKCFETIRAENGKLFHLAYHQERFYKTSGLDLELADFLNPPKDGLYRCKVVYDDTRIWEVLYYRYKKRHIGSLRLLEIDFSYPKKYLQRSDIDRAFECRGECDDVLLIKNGLITDTSIANVAFFDGRRWLTPKKALLEGTTRRRYLQEGKLIQADITPRMLSQFSQMALMNAMIDFDIITISKIDKDRIIAH